MPNPPKKLYLFSSLVEIVSKLRGPKGCPWDKKQTHKSLVQWSYEEVAEFAEALETGRMDLVKEELGDILLQIALHAQIASEKNHFNIYDVIESINQKLIRRHPHVFGSIKAKTSDQVRKNWEAIKATEKKQSASKVLNVPLSLPALQRAQKIGQKTEKVGFDWNSTNEVLKKVDEEHQELHEALLKKNKKQQAEELGDLLFSLAQLGRHLDLDTEQCLRAANRKFERRFEKMHHICSRENKVFETLSSNEKEDLWNRVKKKK